MKKLLYKFFLFNFALCTLHFALIRRALAQLQPIPTTDFSKTIPNALDVVDIQAFEIVFSNIAAIATSLVGLGAFIMIISGGFKWMTSGGDPKKVEAAKQTITYGVIGVALLAIIWLILKFISNFTGVPNILKFTIPK